MKINFFFYLFFLVVINTAMAQSPTMFDVVKRDSILQQIHEPRISDNILNISKFGAKGDGIYNCKPAFDKAIYAAKKRGGAKLIVPAGKYLINGPIHLVSNLCIELQRGATLVFGSNPSDYLPVVKTSWEGTFLYNYSPFIYGYQVQNVAIIGEGIIDGNAATTFSIWANQQKESVERSRDLNHREVPLEKRVFGKGYFLRPQLIQFFESKNILMEGVTVKNSPFWCVHILKSENMIARRIKFDAFNRNNDGFDPEYSKNILIEDIDFNNGDDNVAIKAGRDNEGRKIAIPSENIVIRNCRFKGLHALVIGSEMSAGVQNVFVENCSFGGYLKRGIYLKSNPDRGGFIRNIYIKDVAFGDVEDCFFITSFYHGEGNGHATDIKNIYISNVSCKKANNAGVVIQGFPTKKVRDIYISNLKIDTAKTALSLSNTQNIVLNDVIIGEEILVPSHVK